MIEHTQQICDNRNLKAQEFLAYQIQIARDA